MIWDSPKGTHINPFIKMLIGPTELGQNQGAHSYSWFIGSISRSKGAEWSAWVTCPFSQKRWGVMIDSHTRCGMKDFWKEKQTWKTRNNCPIYFLCLWYSILSFSLLSLYQFSVSYEIFFKFAPYIIYLVLWKIESVINLLGFGFLYSF